MILCIFCWMTSYMYTCNCIITLIFEIIVEYSIFLFIFTGRGSTYQNAQHVSSRNKTEIENNQIDNEIYETQQEDTWHYQKWTENEKKIHSEQIAVRWSSRCEIVRKCAATRRTNWKRILQNRLGRQDSTHYRHPESKASGYVATISNVKVDGDIDRKRTRSTEIAEFVDTFANRWRTKETGYQHSALGQLEIAG